METEELIAKTEMVQLPETFIGTGPYRGFEFTQISVTLSAFLYEVDVAGVKYYHTFEKRENARFGTISYPGPESFGKWAWCYRRYQEAIQKFYSL